MITPSKRTDSSGSAARPASPIDVTAHPSHEKDRAGRLVGRNVFALVASQFVTTPVSIVVNAMMARSLGATNFGTIYLATTTLTLAFLIVEWGGYSQVAASVARDRSTAPRIVGTGLVLRILLSLLVLTLVPSFGRSMGYDETVQLALTLCGFRLALVSLGGLCAAVLRGFEQIRWHAAATVSSSLIDAALVSVTLLAGGGLRGVLTAQAVAAGLGVALQLALIARLRIGRLKVDRGAVKLLVGGGFSFLVLDVILKLQPYIDATFMERLAEPQALGWYSAATRIQGVLMFPATTLTMALYPTLARLYQDDPATCNVMVRLAVRTVTLLGVLAATGTVIFAPLIVGLVYGSAAYAPAAVDLSILSAYVLLVYFNMVLGTFLIVAGRQWKWAFAQSLCLAISLALDPVLIPWAQQTYGNGSIGVCISVVTAECVMVSSALVLLPPGPLDRSLARTLGRSLLAAAGMALVGFTLRRYPLLAIPATLATYTGLLWIQREMDPELLVLMPPGLGVALRYMQRRTTSQ